MATRKRPRRRTQFPPGGGELSPPLVRLWRLNYYAGRLLTPEDLTREQQYHLDSRRRLNQLLHGVGVLGGLELAVTGGGGQQVQVRPGVALDCLGREIVAVDVLEAPIPAGKVLYASVHYLERLVDGVPRPGEHGTVGDTQASRIEEDAELVLELEDPLAAHPRHRGSCGACGLDHALPIGRLRFSGGRWRVDRTYRPPRIGHPRATASRG